MNFKNGTFSTKATAQQWENHVEINKYDFRCLKNAANGLERLTEMKTIITPS